MRTEKIIRSQAKESLKGNWTSAVAGFFLLFAAFLIVQALFELLLSVTGVLSGEEVNKGSETKVLIISIVTFFLAFALTPFKNGFIRLCYNIALGRSDGLRDVFYFFSRINLYVKALQFNIMMALRFVLYFFVALIPYILCLITDIIFFTTSENIAMTIIANVLLYLGIIAASFYSVRLFAYDFAFVDNCEANPYRTANVILKNHSGDYYKLAFSFIFWILSCFFVLPALYVIPYFTTSLGTTSKWLINLYKEGKTV